MTIITESSEGNDVVQEWPTPNFADWMSYLLTVLFALFVERVPGLARRASFVWRIGAAGDRRGREHVAVFSDRDSCRSWTSVRCSAVVSGRLLASLAKLPVFVAAVLFGDGSAGGDLRRGVVEREVFGSGGGDSRDSDSSWRRALLGARILGRLAWKLAETMPGSTTPARMAGLNSRGILPRRSRSAEVSHRVLETRKPSPTSRFGSAGPRRVLRGVDEPLGMRHQTEHAAGRVANAGDVGDGAVGIVGIGHGLLMQQRVDLRLRIAARVGRCRATPDRRWFVAGTNRPSPWATGSSISVMPERKTHLLPATREANPAIFEFAGVVAGERGGGAGGVAGEQQVGLDQDLEAVADAEDQLAGVAERLQCVGQMMADLVAEDAAGGDVVAVAEAAGEAEDLEVGEFLRSFENAVDVEPLRRAAGQLEGVRSLFVAIGAGARRMRTRGDMVTTSKGACQAAFSD